MTTTMRFECDFKNPATSECRSVTVDLATNEVAASQAAEDPNLYAQCYALRRAYPQVPVGFLHVPQGIRSVPVH